MNIVVSDPEIEKIVSMVRVNNLYESIMASGYPMHLVEPYNSVKNIATIDQRDLARACKLGNCPIGSGHDSFLKGINVSFDLTFSNKAWVQAERYSFFNIVSSQSCMHEICRLVRNSKSDDRFSEYTDPRIIDILNEKIENYMIDRSPENKLKVLYSIPSGIKLTAKIDTNYLQLKTIYSQRKTHELPEWRLFCKFIKSLPLAKELFLNDRLKEDNNG